MTTDYSKKMNNSIKKHVTNFKIYTMSHIFTDINS